MPAPRKNTAKPKRKKTPSPKDGRPRIEFNEKQWKQIEEMCKIQCTGEEIAAVMGVDYDTLAARVKESHGVSFSDYIKRHSDGGKASLRRLQWLSAQNGNVTAQIWLGKQILGQSDKADHNVSGSGFVLKIDTGDGST